MDEDVISEIETEFVSSLTLAFVDDNCIANAQGNLFPMERDAF